MKWKTKLSHGDKSLSFIDYRSNTKCQLSIECKFKVNMNNNNKICTSYFKGDEKC